MGKKENILELLKEFDGLTYNKIIDLYNERFNPDTLSRKSGYKYLQRLKNKPLELITSESKGESKGKGYIYKPTAKALTEKPDDLKFLKGLIERGAVKFYKLKIKQDDIDRLKAM